MNPLPLGVGRDYHPPMGALSVAFLVACLLVAGFLKLNQQGKLQVELVLRLIGVVAGLTFFILFAWLAVAVLT